METERKQSISESLRSLVVDGRGKGRKRNRAKQGSQPFFGPLGGMVVVVSLTEIGSVDQTWMVDGMQVLIY